MNPWRGLQIRSGGAKKLLAEAGASDPLLQICLHAERICPALRQPRSRSLNSMLNAGGIKSKPPSPWITTPNISPAARDIRAGNFSKDTLILGAISGGYTVIDESCSPTTTQESGKRFAEFNDP